MPLSSGAGWGRLQGEAALHADMDKHMFWGHERVLGHLNRGTRLDQSGLATSLSMTHEFLFDSGRRR